MQKFAKRLAYAALMAGIAAPAYAADAFEPAPYEPAPVVVEQPAYNGWYIRGDIGYAWSDLRGVDYITYGGGIPGEKSFDSYDLKGAMTLGAGVGYQVTNYFRTDLTADYFFDSDFDGQTSDPFSVSVDTSSYSAFLLLANAYVDLGTYAGFTPYVGAGIGGAYVKWDDLRNTIDPGIDNLHKGAAGWRFAWSLMAGASYCLTDRLALDGGYRYTNVEGGRMFEEYSSSGVSLGAGPGFDDGFNIHEVRAGLRYSFGGNSNCYVPQTVAYEPPPEPVVYK
ncbi:outer membrane protein [Arvimicrobium flavum]|uniref:outer membrane protein n=1 Tax=Arvimicrobium flavum TaxID=3393320 RepID=UPI00237AE9C4|nr:outer membrane protein [Mesorhizobium shangrilense]